MPRKRGSGGGGGSRSASNSSSGRQVRRGSTTARGRRGRGGAANGSGRPSPSQAAAPSSPSSSSSSSSSSDRTAPSSSGTKRRAPPSVRVPPPPKMDEVKIPLADPVEQRWEENAGKYLHKKFKKMATATSEAEGTTSAAVSMPLKHSALSMITSAANVNHNSEIVSERPSFPPQPVIPSAYQAENLSPSASVQQGQQQDEEEAAKRKRTTCPFCQLVCSKPSVLDKHIRTHTNERPYACEPCGFAFKTKSNLYKHRKSQTHILKIERGIDSSSVDIMEELGEDGRAEIDSPVSTAPNPGDRVPAESPPANHQFLPQQRQHVTLHPIQQPSHSMYQKSPMTSISLINQRYTLPLSRNPDPRLNEEQQHARAPLPQQISSYAHYSEQQEGSMGQVNQVHHQVGSRVISSDGHGNLIVGHHQPLSLYVGHNSQIRPRDHRSEGHSHHAALTVLPPLDHTNYNPRFKPNSVGHLNQLHQQQHQQQQRLAHDLSDARLLPTAPLPLLRYSEPSSAQELSDSQQQSVPTDLSAKKVGAETLQQRIDKVISQNQAIVETLDPLWPRRYMRQNSKDGDDKGSRCGRKYSLTCPTTLTSGSSAVVTKSSYGHVPLSQQSLPSGGMSVKSSNLIINNLSKSVTLEAQPPSMEQRPLELTTRHSQEPILKSQPVMLLRQNATESNLSVPFTAQSVKEVWINSCKNSLKQPPLGGNIAQLEDIASSLEGNPFHPSNPEGSMIKELLLKTRGLGGLPGCSSGTGGVTTISVTTARSTNSADPTPRSSPSCVIEIKSMGSLSTRDSHLTQIAFTDPSRNHKMISTLAATTDLVRCNQCMSVFKAADVDSHKKYCQRPRAEDDYAPVEKRSRMMDNLAIPMSPARMLTGGIVRSVEQQQQTGSVGLLQVAPTTGFHSGGGIVLLNQISAPRADSKPINSDSLQKMISSTTFTIPGIPTPSLSGFLTGIKSAPLFSLPGQRVPTTNDSSSNRPQVPFVLGIPGPYSQASSTSPAKLGAFTSTTSVMSLASRVVPVITVSPASAREDGVVDEVKIEVDQQEDSKFLRPSSLALTPGSFRQKKHVMLTSGDTLISPETPRPRKSYVLTYQNGTAYTHLGMKCSTRVYYCCLFRQQPMYVHHKGKLSMYSNWKVVSRDSHSSGMTPKEFLASYNSTDRDRDSVYGIKTVSRSSKVEMLMTHSSQWNESEKRMSGQEDSRSKAKGGQEKTGDKQMESNEDEDRETTGLDGDVEGGYKTTDEEYTYVRGRGRGRYVCNSCGIRCKKPSMLKKHIRTHSNFRPHTCKFCNFSFKTKGNLTKHMKSKAHHKKCVELGISPDKVPTSVEETQTFDASDNKQNKLPNGEIVPGDSDSDDDDDLDDDDEDEDDQFEDAEDEEEGPNEEYAATAAAAHSLLKLKDQNRYVSDPALGLTFGRPRSSACTFAPTLTSSSPMPVTGGSSQSVVSTISSPGQLYEYGKMSLNAKSVLELEQEGKPNLLSSPPNTAEKYYFRSSLPKEGSDNISEESSSSSVTITRGTVALQLSSSLSTSVPRAVQVGHSAVGLAISKGAGELSRSLAIVPDLQSTPPQLQAYLQERAAIRAKIQQESNYTSQETNRVHLTLPTSLFGSTRLGSVDIIRSPPNQVIIDRVKTPPESSIKPKPLLLIPSSSASYESATNAHLSQMNKAVVTLESPSINVAHERVSQNHFVSSNSSMDDGSFAPRNVTMNVKDLPLKITRGKSPLPTSFNSQSQLLPKDLNTIAQMKAASVANSNYANRDAMTIMGSSFSSSSPAKDSLQRKDEDRSPTTSQQQSPATSKAPPNSIRSNQNIMATTAEGKPFCDVCKKVFSKPSQLRLHSNIHYMERPFRCEDCAVSFRTKGHLQKHERSAGHFNKVNINQTFGAPSTLNPRPFKCADCMVKFRIHGHLAKHLRSKLHIMKLECSGKLPIGIFAEMERLGTNLNEIDTTNCSSALASLELLSEKLYGKDPSKLPHLRQSAEGSEVAPRSPEVKVEPPEPLASTSRSSSSDGSERKNFNSFSSHLHPHMSLPSTYPSEKEKTTVDQVHPSNSFFRNPSQMRRASFSSGPEDRSTDSETEGCNSKSSASKIPCHQCSETFPDMKALQIHIFVDHHSTPPPPPPPLPGPSSTAPTYHNGELLAAARMVNLSQSLSSPSSRQPSSSREGSVASSSEGEDKSSYTCDLCGKLLVSRSAFQQHLLSHAAPRPHICSHCDAGFTTFHQLETHMKLH